ncbi:MAG: hypothetical protein M0C28_38550 [Candidatus Moduliflexus flocculans]|nr:hypothetical protein [Candidatus Moduliflexus flocculans]
MRIHISEKAAAVGLALAAVLVSTAVPALAQERQSSPALTALVPRLEGWAPAEAPRGYFPESLFEYINGAAESYLSYDFRELVVADFQKKGTEATLTAEIYDMGDPLNAFGIYGAERYPENEPVGVGDLDYLEGEALNFLAGRYYVKLLAFGLGAETEKVLREAGSKIAGAIGPKTGLPLLVRAFPAEGLVPRSEKYIKRNFMGYEFLGNGYVAAYRSDGKEMEGFFVDAATGPQAEAALARFLEAVAADGQVPEKVPGGVKLRNRYGQTVFIGRVGSVLCGAMRVPVSLEAAGQKLFGSLAASLSALGSAK